MILRPYAMILDGRLETGLEAEVDDRGEVLDVRSSAHAAEEYVLSPAFVNAHSHLEYRGLQGGIVAIGYFKWIKSITSAKREQSLGQVREDCLLAALENRRTGVAYIAEHSDRPFSGEAMATHGIDGVIFQEVITLAEGADPADKLELVTAAMRQNAKSFGGEVHINPHAPWTVDEATLRSIASAEGRASIHVAESVHENDYFERDKGPIAKACKAAGTEHTMGQRVVEYLAWLGYLRPGVQFVHCCDVNSDEVCRIANAGVSVAHCPRSNEALDCPRAPLREMLDSGVQVGIGLDSAASSGPIDMFAEMRAALDVARLRGADVTPEEVWRAATTMGARSLGIEGWGIGRGSSAPLIKIHVSGATNTDDLMGAAGARSVEWVTPAVHN